MTNQTATEASNTFWQNFNAERQAIEGRIQQLATVSKGALPAQFHSILEQINELEKTFTKSIDFVPSYDERQYLEQLRALGASLEAAKANLTPKAKFSFKSRKPKRDASNIPTTPQPTIPDTPNTATASLQKDDVISFANKTDAVIQLENQPLTAVHVTLSKLRRCVVLLHEHPLSSLHIEDLKECLVICSMIQGSVLIYGISSSVMAVGCHQFRMHDALDVDILYNVNSRPIIEDSSDVRVAEYSAISTEATNYFDQVNDFNWLKKETSPNWSVMSDSESERLNHLVSKIDPSSALAVLSEAVPRINA